jgi:hypothetical protein
MEFHRVADAIYRPVEIGPTATDLDIRLIRKPDTIGRRVGSQIDQIVHRRPLRRQVLQMSADVGSLSRAGTSTAPNNLGISRSHIQSPRPPNHARYGKRSEPERSLQKAHFNFVCMPVHTGREPAFKETSTQVEADPVRCLFPVPNSGFSLQDVV